MNEQGIESGIEIAMERGEIGFQVAAYLGEELVLDRSVGIADERNGRPVTAETLFPIFSVNKAFVATCVHLQAERGFLDIDEPIATYWPEYGQHGKDKITSRHVLMHRSSVPQMPSNFTPDSLADRDAVLEYLVNVEPLGEPGTRSIHHAISFGYILGEVLTRTDPKHRDHGTFIREEICDPLGINDLWVGLPAAEEPRVAHLTWGRVPPAEQQPNEFRLMTMPAGFAPSPEVSNRREFHQACVPGVSGITTARGGARFFALLANGGTLEGKRLLSEELLFSLTEPRPRPDEPEEDSGNPISHSVGGFRLGGASPPAEPCLGPDAHVLGHGGAGGSVGFADLDRRLAVMITHNRLFAPTKRDLHPFVPLCDAIREFVD